MTDGKGPVRTSRYSSQGNSGAPKHGAEGFTEGSQLGRAHRQLQPWDAGAKKRNEDHPAFPYTGEVLHGPS